METGGEHFSDESGSLLKELSPGEKLIWCGHPQSARRLVWHSIPKALLGLAFVTFTLLWMIMVVRGGHNNWDRGRAVPPFAPHNALIATLAGLCFLPPGLFMLTWPLRTWRRLGKTRYALTDRRAIVGEPSLLGRIKLRSYAADSLRLMRLEEHDDGTGDLIFESPSTWVGMAQTIGFLAIKNGRDAEVLVQRMLLSSEHPESKSRSRAGEAPAMSDRKTYRLSPGVRLFQFVALAGGLLLTFCVVGNLVLFLVVQVIRPGLVLDLIPHEMKRLGTLGVVGSIAAGIGSLLAAGFVAWGFFRFALAIPIEIIIDEDGTVGFRSRLRTVLVPAGDITSIRTGGWSDPNRFPAVVRHRGGKLTLINQFPDFRDFLATLKVLNPAVEIKGF